MSNILVLIPHSGKAIPKEIEPTNIRKEAVKDLQYEVDVGTDEIFDFKQYFNNDQFVFKYNRGLIDVNESPKDLNASIDLKTFFDKPIYKKDLSIETRKILLNKYHKAFHNDIEQYFKSHLKPLFILDCHSSYENEKGDSGDEFKGDIEVANVQIYRTDKNKMMLTCPDNILYSFIKELKEVFNDVRGNTDYLTKTYGYIEDHYSQDFKVPTIIIEIKKELFLDKNKKIVESKVKELNTKLAMCVKNTIEKLM